MSGASVLSVGGEASQHAGLPQARLARIFAEQHTLVWRVLRRLGLSPEAAADATGALFERCAGELATCASGKERAVLLGMALSQLDAEPGRCNTGRRAEPGRSGVVHAAPLRASSAHADVMDRAILRMTRPSAVLFVLFELEGLSLREAAEVMAVDADRAACILTQARTEFRAIAAELFEAVRR